MRPVEGRDRTRFVQVLHVADGPRPEMLGAGSGYGDGVGVLLVRKAGGEVVNLEGEPIDAVGHQGPFVAAVDAANRQVVVDIAREVVGLGA